MPGARNTLVGWPDAKRTAGGPTFLALMGKLGEHRGEPPTGTEFER